jgi:hypothetical protein
LWNSSRFSACLSSKVFSARLVFPIYQGCQNLQMHNSYRYNHYAYVIHLKFSIWKSPSKYFANTFTAACCGLLPPSNIGRSDIANPGWSPTRACQRYDTHAE